MELFLVQRPEVINPVARRKENSRKIAVLTSALESRCKPGEETRLLESVKETREVYVDSYQRAIQLLLEEKKRDAAREVMVQQTTPALYRYHSAWDEFLRFQKEEVELASEHSKQQYAAARRIALLFILMAGVLGSAVAWIAPPVGSRASSDGKFVCGGR